jgi:hypothetical protein
MPLRRGALHLALDALPATYACHCRDCQTWSGSAFSLNTFVPEDALSASGPLVVFELTTPSGRVSRQRMCGQLPHADLQHQQRPAERGGAARRHARPQRRARDRRAHLGEAQARLVDAARRVVPTWPEAADPPAALVQALARR